VHGKIACLPWFWTFGGESESSALVVVTMSASSRGHASPRARPRRLPGARFSDSSNLSFFRKFFVLYFSTFENL